MRKVLLSLCGLTPQVITETLYALTVDQDPAWFPDEIHVITTESGRLLVEEKLLHPSQGRFYQLCSEYKIPGPKFDAQTIHVIADEDRPMYDIRSQADNSHLADGILHIVRSLCKGPDTLIHASLAGGRKTMSFYLGMAMQLFAKDSDQLSHVLVRPPFENHPDFFYPPKIPREYTVFDPASGKPYTVSSAQATIELAMIPFVRLKDFTTWEEKKMGFSEHVASVQQILQKSCTSPTLSFDPGNLELWVDNKYVTLTPTEAALYQLLLRAKQDCARKSCADCIQCYIDPFELNTAFIQNFLSQYWGHWSEKAGGLQIQNKNGLELKNWFLQHRSRINKKLQPIDPMGLAKIISVGGYGQKRYGIAADKILLSTR
jgi:CRISPR-associated protein (TIGR02584 family)